MNSISGAHLQHIRSWRTLIGALGAVALLGFLASSEGDWGVAFSQGTAGAGPDLTFTMILVGNVVDITVRNEGNLGSAATTIEIGLGSGTTLTAVPNGCTPTTLDLLVCQVPILAPGGEFSFTISLTTMGQVVFTSAAIDPGNLNQELNENNNRMTDLTIQVLRSGISSSPGRGGVGVGGSPPVGRPPVMTPLAAPQVGGGAGGFSSSGGTGVSPPDREPSRSSEPPLEPSPTPTIESPVPEAPLPGLPPGPTPPDCVDYLVVFGPYPVFSAIDNPPMAEPIWIAQPGEWYVVQLVEGGFALAVLDTDATIPGNDSPVWFEIRGDPVGIEGVRTCG